MKGHSDDWIEDRVIWRLKREKWPMTGVYVFKDHSYAHPERLQSFKEDLERCGRPIVAVIGTNQLWTAIGSEAIVSIFGGQKTIIRLDDIREAMVEDEEAERDKGRMEYWTIRCANGESKRIWLRPDPTFSMVGGILIMLERMVARAREKPTDQNAVL